MQKILNYKFAFLISIGIIFNQKAFSQGAPACPQVTSGIGVNMSYDTTVCQAAAVTLNANLVTNHQTTSYSVDTISYAPYPMTGGTPVSVNTDDIWSSIITLPFNFCYFGNTYNQCIIGSNGELSFDLANAGINDNWPITTAIPSTANMPGNTICAVFRDIDPTFGGNVGWYLTGTAPCRALVVYWNNIPLYSCGAPNSTFELVLYENTNFIDVYVQNSSNSCTTWQNGYGIIGIQNSTATTAVVPTGYNYPSAWTVTNQAWRFTPTGAPSYTFNWYSAAAPLVSLGTSLSLVVNPMDTTQYFGKMVLTNCDSSTLTFSDTVQVNITSDSSYINILNPDTAICSGSSMTLNTSVNLPGGAYSWQPGGQSTSSINVNPTTNTTYYVTYDNGTQCTFTDSITISVFAGPTVTTIDTTICNVGDTITLPAVPNVPGGSYTWSPGGQTTQNIQVSPSSTTNYIINYTIAGCPGTATDTATVTVNPLPNIIISGDTAICTGDSTTLMVSGGNTYLWQPSGDTTNSITLNSGNVSVIGTDINGCVDSASTTITINPFPIANFSFNPDSACGRACVQFTNNSSIQSGTMNYYWIFGDGDTSTSNNPNHCFDLNNGNILTTYFPKLIATSNAGCKDSLTSPTPVVVLPIPTASFVISPTPPVKPNTTLKFTSTSTDAYSYLWESNDGQSDTDSIATFKYSAPGTYSVCLTVTNIYGCEDSACENIEVQDDFFMPNVITPNGDGINDNLVIKGLPIEGNNAITIYDRWGKKIYHSDNYKNDWSGTNKGGKKLSDGTYYYILLLGNDKKQTGYITILN